MRVLGISIVFSPPGLLALIDSAAQGLPIPIFCSSPTLGQRHRPRTTAIQQPTSCLERLSRPYANAKSSSRPQPTAVDCLCGV
jgi:hypothetical protein